MAIGRGQAGAQAGGLVVAEAERAVEAGTEVAQVVGDDGAVGEDGPRGAGTAHAPAAGATSGCSSRS